MPISRRPIHSSPTMAGANPTYVPHGARRRTSGCASVVSSFDSSCSSDIDATIPSLTRCPVPLMYA